MVQVRPKASKSRLVQDRLGIVNSRIDELTKELDLLSQEKEKLDIAMEVLESIGIKPIIDDSSDVKELDNVAGTVMPIPKQKNVRPRRGTKVGTTEKIVKMLEPDGVSMTYEQIVEVLSLDGEVNRASLTATLSRMAKQKRIERVGGRYRLYDEDEDNL